MEQVKKGRFQKGSTEAKEWSKKMMAAKAAKKMEKEQTAKEAEPVK